MSKFTNKIEKLILEQVLVEENYKQDWDEDFLERYDNHMYNILGDYVAGVPRIKWKVIPAPRLIKIWKDFSKLGFVRDEKVLI